MIPNGVQNGAKRGSEESLEAILLNKTLRYDI